MVLKCHTLAAPRIYLQKQIVNSLKSDHKIPYTMKFQKDDLRIENVEAGEVVCSITKEM